MYVLVTWRLSTAATTSVDQRTHSVLKCKSDPRATRRISKSVTTPASSCPLKSCMAAARRLGCSVWAAPRNALALRRPTYGATASQDMGPTQGGSAREGDMEWPYPPSGHDALQQPAELRGCSREPSCLCTKPGIPTRFRERTGSRPRNHSNSISIVGSVRLPRFVASFNLSRCVSQLRV